MTGDTDQLRLSIEDNISALLKENEALKERVKRLKEALEPFAENANAWDSFPAKEHLVEAWSDAPRNVTDLTVAHLRRARVELEKDSPNA